MIITKKLKNWLKRRALIQILAKNRESFFNTEWVNTLRHILSAPSVAGFNQAEHELLKNIPTEFVTDRLMKEFTTDHLLMGFLPLSTMDRAHFKMDYLEQLAANADNLAWSGKPQLNDVWTNVIAAFFVMGGQLTMAYTKKTGVVEKAQAAQELVYEPIEKHTHKITHRSQNEGTFYGRALLSYFASGGQQDNLGDVMWRRYKSRFRSLQMTLALAVGLRLILGGQPPMDALLGVLLFHFAGQWIYAWPWDIIHGGAKINQNKLAENQKKMEDVKLKLSRVTKGTHQNIEELRAEYESAVNEIMTLYDKKGLRKSILESGIRSVNETLFRYLIRGRDIRFGAKGQYYSKISCYS